MDPTNAERSARKRQLDEIVTAYLQCVEAGTPPDRQEPLARHPDLNANFAAQDQLARLTAAVPTPISLRGGLMPAIDGINPPRPGSLAVIGGRFGSMCGSRRSM